MRKKSGKSTTILLVLLLLVGLSVMLYPTISDWWNSKTQSRAVATYQKAANDLSDKENEEILSRAKARFELTPFNECAARNALS